MVEILDKIAQTGGDLLGSIGSGLQDAGQFVVDMVQDDVKDAIKTYRSFGNPFSAVPGNAEGKMVGEVFKALGWNDLERETNPDNLSTGEKASAGLNTVLNAASLVPGIGAGIKSAQAGVRASKLFKAGAGLSKKGAVNKARGIIGEKRANDFLAKAIESAMPENLRRRAKNMVSDEAVDWWAKTGGKIKDLGKDYPQIQHLVDLYNRSARGKAAKQILKEAGNRSVTGDFLMHVGKVTTARGIRVAGEAAKHGFKAGKKQFVTQAANTWRKSGSDSEKEAPASASKQTKMNKSSSSSSKKKKKKRQY